MKTNNYLYIFLHPPKTGGESFTTFIENHLFPGETFRVNNQKLSNLNLIQKQKIKFVAGHLAYFGIHKFFKGKIPRYMTSIRDPADALVSLYNTRMEDFPSNRIQSFEKWYSLKKRNEYTRFFDLVFRSRDSKVAFSKRLSFRFYKILNKLDKSKTIHTLLKKLVRKKASSKEDKQMLENAKKLLDECWFVSITETQREDLKFLFKIMDSKVNMKNYKILSKESRVLFELDEKTRKKIYKENPLDVELYEYALKLNKEKKKKLKNSF